MKAVGWVGVAVAGVAAALAMAGTQVPSQNVVGTVPVTVPPSNSYVLCGFNFRALGGTNAALEQVFGARQLVQGATGTRASRVYFWNSVSQQYFTVFQKTDGNFYHVESGARTNYTISPGEAFWIQSPGGQYQPTNRTIYLAGQLLSQDDYQRAQPMKFLLIGNPFAHPLDLNGTSVNWIADGARAGTTATRADNVYIWNGAALDRYFLRSVSSKWFDAGTATLATNAVIPVGGGAWYSCTLTNGRFTSRILRPFPWQ